MNKLDFIYLDALSSVKGIGDSTLSKILLKFGEAESVFNLVFEPDTPWERKVHAKITKSNRDQLLRDAEVVYEKLQDLGAHAISLLDDEYPFGLLQLSKAPPILYIQGALKTQDHYAVSVVGTRKPSRTGMLKSRRLAKALAECNITVISGLALGIDAAAHRGAITAGGRTIAVIGSGLDIRYPPENSKLWDEILDNDGAVISQFPPGNEPLKWHFPERNWTMSGMSQGTIVVEASQTSGAKLQAQFAAEQERILFLTKHQVTNFEWARDLAEEDKAIVIRDIDDIIDVLHPTETISTIPDNLKIVNTLI